MVQLSHLAVALSAAPREQLYAALAVHPSRRFHGGQVGQEQAHVQGTQAQGNVEGTRGGDLQCRQVGQPQRRQEGRQEEQGRQEEEELADRRSPPGEAGGDAHFCSFERATSSSKSRTSSSASAGSPA